MTTNTKRAACDGCGQDFFYEPILFYGRDLAAMLNRHCDHCKDLADAQAAKLEKERVMEQRRATVLATLDPEMLPVTLDPLGTDPTHPDFNRQMWDLVRKWRPGPHGSWIALVGPAGACKTRCLALLAEKIIMAGNRLTWTSAMKLHREVTLNIRDRNKNIAANARDHLEECRTTPWLVLDDLGNNEWTPAFESQLFTILDYRKNNRLPIAYSSNAHPEEFHGSITSVNPAALIGRLLDRTTVFDFSANPQMEMP